MVNYSEFKVGRSSGKTIHGIPTNVLKSALQKYIRRGETIKALQCILESNSFILLENANEDDTLKYVNENSQKNISKKGINMFGKCQRTNIANRLLVICSEEININDNPKIPIYIWNLYNKWINNREKENSINYLIQAGSILSTAKKGRTISHLKSAYNLPPYYVKSKYRDKYNKFYVDNVKTKLNEEIDCDINLTNLLKFIDDRDLNKVFNLIGLMCINSTDKQIKNLLKDIWKHLSFINQNKSIKCLNKIYNKMSHEEKPIYLYHALLLHIYEDKLIWNSPLKLERIPKINYFNNINDLHENYIYDHHINGKKNINSYIKLLKESFLIPDNYKNTDFINTKLEQLYIYIKLAVGYFEEHKTFPDDTEINKLRILLQ